MKKKGFTLIELLAVIVILAIIALIAIPLIGNVIEKAKIGALENSINGLVESANMYYANQNIKGEQATETIFDFANGEQTSTSKLEYKGKVYNGKLILHANGEVAVCIDDKEHYAYKNKDTDEIISGIGTCLYDGTTGDFSSNSPVEDIKKQVAAATATSDKVLEGSTIYTLSGLVAGTMANNANKTLSATTVTESEDKTNALISIPSNGYYSTSSKISVPIETIKNEITIYGKNNLSFVGGIISSGTKSYAGIFDKSFIPTIDNFVIEPYSWVSSSNCGVTSINKTLDTSNKNINVNQNCVYIYRSGSGNYVSPNYIIYGITYANKTLLASNVSGVNEKSIDLSSYSDCDSFTIENFAIDMTGISTYSGTLSAVNFTKSYNQNTCTLSLSKYSYAGSSYESQSAYGIYNVYLIR